MTRKTRMLTSAAALALIGSTALAPAAMADPIPAAASYADLLEPVPDALARLHADDAMAADAHMIQAQYRGGYDHHHHHHHHVRHSARWYRGHGYFWTGQIWAFGVPPQPRYWHNHDADWYRGRGYSWDGRGWQQPRGHDHHHHADPYRGNGYDQRQNQDGRGQQDHHHHHHHQNWR